MKRYDIIIDALGTLDDKTLDVPEKPEKERGQSLLPQVLAACAVLLVLAVSLPFLRMLVTKTPNDPLPAASGDDAVQTAFDTEERKENNKTEWKFTTENQPASEPGWDFCTDKVIDAEAQPYFPDLTTLGCEITGHNAAIFPAASVLEAYFNKLVGQGFARMQCGDENLFYSDGVLIREQRCANPKTHRNDSFCVNVYVHHQTAGGVTADEAIGIINENCLKEMITQRGDNNQLVEVEFTHDPVPFAADITPPGFFGLTGMQIFVCPWTKPNRYEFPYAVAFFVNKNGAVRTDMGCDQRTDLSMSVVYNDVEMCLSKDGYSGAPILCDIDGDGRCELILLTPYTTYQYDKAYLTVYDTGTPAVLARSKQLTFKAERQELLYAEGGHAVLHSVSGDGTVDAYFEIEADLGQIALYDVHGKAVDLNLLPESPLDTDISPTEPYKFTVIDEDDEFVKEELVDEKTSLTQDDLIDRIGFSWPLMFEVDGKKCIIGSEYDKNIRFFEEADGEFKDAGGYKFRYNSLAMLYMANRPDGRNVYAPSGFICGGIYRYDLLTGDVYTFIKTKHSCSSPYYVNGMLLYVSLKNNVYTLKAAVLSEKKIYRICEMSTGDHPIIAPADNGAFAVIGKTVYFMGLSGKAEKIAELPDAGTSYYVDEEKLYVWDRTKNTLTAVDRYGNTLTHKAEGAVRANTHAGAASETVTFKGALVSLVKNEGGGFSAYLYDPGKDAKEDISPETDVKFIGCSACVCGDGLYVFAQTEKNLYLFEYSSNAQKLILRKTF